MLNRENRCMVDGTSALSIDYAQPDIQVLPKASHRTHRNHSQKVHTIEISRREEIAPATLIALIASTILVVFTFVAIVLVDQEAHARAIDKILNESTKVSYVVKAGDTLSGIAAKTGLDQVHREHLVKYLYESNHLQTKLLQPGQLLTIPTNN